MPKFLTDSLIARFTTRSAHQAAIANHWQKLRRL
jgi:hypothetical protein